MLRHLFLVCFVPAIFVFRIYLLPASDEAERTAEMRESTELIFSHQYHIEEEELECGDCHEEAELSQTGSDNLLPGKDVCESCHEVEDENECGTCHSDVANAREVPRIIEYSEKFSHAIHLDAELSCQNCHAEVASKETAELVILPTMVACVDCHENRIVDTMCETCHLPDDRLTPLSHTPDFIHKHSDLARIGVLSIDGDKTCQTCHTDNFCQDCHEGDNLDRTTHPLNFEFTHALQAQANEKTCVVCHTETQFCVDCHRDNLVLPHSHTPGWVNAIPGDGGRHRFEALSDLETCISCHETDADRICQPCHGGPN